jgi:hypothetical protein
MVKHLCLPRGIAEAVHQDPRKIIVAKIDSISERSACDRLAGPHKHSSGAQEKRGAAWTHVASYMRLV